MSISEDEDDGLPRSPVPPMLSNEDLTAGTGLKVNYVVGSSSLRVPSCLL